MKYFYLFPIITILFSCNSDTKTSESNNASEVTEVITKDLNKTLISKMNTDNNADTYLHLVSNDITGITFENTIIEDVYHNHKSYPQIYNGGGVAVGDLNNDGLPDIYFAGNSVKDKIYFNTGNFTFKDVTEASGIGK